MLTVTEDEKTEAKADVKPTSVRLDPEVMARLDRIAELMHEQRLQARPNRSAALAWVLTNIDWNEVEKRLTKKK